MKSWPTRCGPIIDSRSALRTSRIFLPIRAKRNQDFKSFERNVALRNALLGVLSTVGKHAVFLGYLHSGCSTF